MDNYTMTPAEAHYSHQSQRQWPPHLLPSQHSAQSSFSSPVSPPSTMNEHGQHYSTPFYQQGQQGHQGQGQSQPGQAPSDPGAMHHINRTTSSLSLNLQSLTVTSPTNMSPINPPPNHSSALSPVTPLSPSTNPFHHTNISSQFQFSAPEPSSANQSQPSQSQNSSVPYDESTPQQYDRRMAATPTTSRSSSSSTSTTSTTHTSLNISLPRKRSFSSNAASTETLVEEVYDEAAMDLSSNATSASSGYEDMDMRYNGTPGPGSNTGGGGSPVDGSGSGSGGEDGLGVGLCGGLGSSSGNGNLNNIGMSGAGMGGSMNILGKPMATNNFVTKLYQMINDPKSAHFITWTELGTSFVVSNVGEFSRSILGSHFKHNNFSSFVRQLNMYGFHKINRTPRAQRTSTDAQTWEFSHHKFLRGRPDLLDEIKRKALEPDPAFKHRVELPGEVAAQLGAMREENRRVWEQLAAEKRRTEKLVNVVGRLWDVVSKGFPGSVPPFPADLLEPNENPNIYVTSPTSPSRYPPPLSMNIGQPMQSIHSLGSPNSSPTASDFPSHVHHPNPHSHPQSLSRQHSFQHVSFSRSEGTSASPLPPSPGSISMELFDDSGNTTTSGDGPVGRVSTKRLRMSSDDSGINAMNAPGITNDSISTLSSPGGLPSSTVAAPVKKFSRARSDSAPLGYGLNTWQGATRPRSGSNLAGQRGVSNIGSMARNSGTPLLPISTMVSNGNSPR